MSLMTEDWGRPARPWLTQILHPVPPVRRSVGTVVRGPAGLGAAPKKAKRHEKAGDRIAAVMCDGRSRPLEQIAEAAGVSESTVQKHFVRLSAAGEVEITVVAGRWLYGITNFGG